MGMLAQAIKHDRRALWHPVMQGGSKGVPRRFTPVLKGVREEVQDGMYALVSGIAR